MELLRVNIAIDNTPHDDEIPDHTCYCLNWCSEDQREREEYPSRDERRKMAIKYILTGKLCVYLAYADGKIVGWCNVNAKKNCLNCFGWQYYMPEVNKLEMDESEKVKSIYCFMIAPWMKRKGIATKLLEYACEDAKRDGYTYLEAYPQKQKTDIAQFYTGFTELYKKCGFSVYMKTEQRYVMRKKLSC